MRVERLGDAAYSLEPADDVGRLRLLLDLRKQQKEERRRWNKILRISLDNDRLGTLSWCICTSSGLEPNCTTDHHRPKAAFCCQEAASSHTTFGLAYRAKLGSGSCIVNNEAFQRRALEPEKIRGWADILREQNGLSLPEYYENCELRRAAYRSVTLWIHGTLGTKNRVPLSSCIVHAIRKAFPNEAGRPYKDYASDNEISVDSDDDTE